MTIPSSTFYNGTGCSVSGSSSVMHICSKPVDIMLNWLRLLLFFDIINIIHFRLYNNIVLAFIILFFAIIQEVFGTTDMEELETNATLIQRGVGVSRFFSWWLTD